jgi:hypothetical protein
MAEPDLKTALAYTEGNAPFNMTEVRKTLTDRTAACFTHGLHVAFGLVDRHAFEQRLRAQLESQNFGIEDPAWYALRHTIYAHGCRIMLADGDYASTFAKARSQSRRYFENALSVFSQLVFMPNGIDSVHTLVMMVRLIVCVISS